MLVGLIPFLALQAQCSVCYYCLHEDECEVGVSVLKLFLQHLDLDVVL